MNKLLSVSILNSIFHSRIFYKEAITLSKILSCSIYVAGCETRTIQNLKPFLKNGIIALPTFSGIPKGISRLLVQIKILFLIFRISPNIIHLHTPELIPAAFIYYSIKWIKGENVVITYIVHEDYYKNFLFSGSYLGLTKHILANISRVIEYSAVRTFISNVIYTEESYDNILHAPAPKVSIIRNKAIIHPPPHTPPLIPDNYLLYSGTLAENWGIFTTLELWEFIYEELNLPLIIAGYTYNTLLWKKLKKRISESRFKAAIYCVNDNQTPLDHKEICQYIEHCYCGFALYQTLSYIKDKIPTKFYEYLAYRKPLLFTQNPKWDNLNNKLNFGKSVTFPLKGNDRLQIITWLKNSMPDTYTKNIDKAEFDWDYEAQVFKSIYSIHT